MLNIYLGEMKGAVDHPPTYFDNRYEDEWITDPLSVEMIRQVDRSEVIGAHLIESPVLGPISVKDLSGGAASGIDLSCDVPCRVLEGTEWKLLLEHTFQSV